MGILPRTHERRKRNPELEAALAATVKVNEHVTKLQEQADAEENNEFLKQERPIDEEGDLAQRAFGSATAAELRDKTIQRAKPIIEDLIVEGLDIVAGPPKQGKSWLVLNIACAKASGGKALSRYPVSAADVLYLALEDSERRMQDRLNALLGEEQQWPPQLFLEYRAPPIGAGFEEALTGWLNTHPDAALVVVDTYAKIKSQRKKNDDPYQADYASISRLQQIALERHVAILLVHHTKKAAEEDFLASVSGTFGVTGPADAVYVLKRKRGEDTGKLLVTGRDIEEQELALKLVDGDWICVGDAAEANRSASRQAILAALADGPRTPSALTKATGKNGGTVRRMLQKMLDKGEVVKTGVEYSRPRKGKQG